MSGYGPVVAAVWNYVICLNRELVGTGVFAGIIHLCALLVESDLYNMVIATNPQTITMKSEDAASVLWEFVQKGDKEEISIP